MVAVYHVDGRIAEQIADRVAAGSLSKACGWGSREGRPPAQHYLYGTRTPTGTTHLPTRILTWNMSPMFTTRAANKKKRKKKAGAMTSGARRQSVTTARPLGRLQLRPGHLQPQLGPTRPEGERSRHRRASLPT